MQKMRDTRDQFIAPKMGQIHEDNSEYDGTFKNNTRGSNNPFAMPSPDMRRLDSIFGDTNNLVLPWIHVNEYMFVFKYNYSRLTG